MIPTQSAATVRRGAAAAALEVREAVVFRAERWAVGRTNERWMNMKEE
jgi:hypothetical protein